MGLGTKIKEVLNGDRDRHYSQTKRTPGAYPESIPRTYTQDTQFTTQTATNKPAAPVTTRDDQLDVAEYPEYTHTPTEEKTNAYDGVATTTTSKDKAYAQELEPKVTGTPRSGKLAKENKHPYWGDAGKPINRDFSTRSATHGREVAATSDRDSGIYGTGASKDSDEFLDNSQTTGVLDHESLIDPTRTTYDTGLVRNGTVSGGQVREPKTTTFDVPPTGSVNRGKPVFVNDDAGRATSLAASQLSQFHDEPDARDFEAVGYTGKPTHTYNQFGTAETTGVNGYRNTSGAYPTANGNGKHTFNGEYAAAGPLVSDLPERNITPGISKSNTFATQASGERERSSPVGGSEHSSAAGAIRNGSADHYGPGHLGARVMHRCHNCGTDNDITRYFSRDVVYRLS